MTDTNKLRQRTLVSFAVLGLFFGAFALSWTLMRSPAEDDDTPAAFRTTLELNGKIWKALFNSGRISRASSKPDGKIPRVNGTIGMEGEFDPTQWELQIETDDHDPAARKFLLHIGDLKALPRTETSTEFRCIEGWSEDMSFAGVKFSDLVAKYNLKTLLYVGLESSDGEYYVSIDIESMMHEQTLLAYEMNGAPLKAQNGAPLRLVIPVKYGIKNLKRIGKIFFSNERPRDYWAERGYDWYAGL
jgi:DMSO/TMAO reductase YedYZ molybdopterin-dependent catalytic subunit